MKPNIHPKHQAATVHCACGTEFETFSARPEIRVEICSNCHPFYTGKQKIVDTEGRVEKFMQRYGMSQKAQAAKSQAAAARKR
jgi:large subunit ribosomal protein L31